VTVKEDLDLIYKDLMMLLDSGKLSNDIFDRLSKAETIILYVIKDLED